MKKSQKKLNLEHIEYLKGIFGEADIKKFLRMKELRADTLERWLRSNPEDRKMHDRVQKCLNQMQKSGDNCWWASKDKRELGYYQLMNPILLVPFDKFHEALEFLLGRPVWTHEMGLNYKGLVEEARRAFGGNQDSEEQRAESVQKSFEQLAELGKPVIGVVMAE